MKSFLRLLTACSVIVIGNTGAFASIIGVVGDYNNDGKVTHADYVTLSSVYGTATALPNDPIGGTIGNAQFDQYRAAYGDTSSLPSPLTFSITPSALGGNIQWVLTFASVSGAGLAGHVNVSVEGSTFLSVIPGPEFTDNGDAMIGVPGFFGVPGTTIKEGVYIDPDPPGNTRAFAALGTTLGTTYSNATLTFATFVTSGLQPTTFKVFSEHTSSEFAVQSPAGGPAVDFFFDSDQTATFAAASSAVPEAGGMLVWTCLSLVVGMVSAIRCRRR